VLSVVVAGDRSLRETTEIADKKIKRVLETVDGVGEVSLTGRPPAPDPHLRGRGQAVRLRPHHHRRPAGHREGERRGAGGHHHPRRRELGVRTLGRLDAVSQFGEIIVRNVGGTPIRVSDLGRVEDSFAEPRTWNMLEGKQAVTLEIRRQSGTNTVKIIDTIKEKLAQIDKTLPPGVATRIIATSPSSSTPPSRRWKSTSSSGACSPP
jgi:HAE1 family hydrophobic/amphiphilic exporter-1